MTSETTTAQQAIERTEQPTRQILTFLLNGQDYGLDLQRVQEIRGFTPITPVPNLPAHIKGVMNLRGSVLPVVDLRVKFGMPTAEYTKFTVIIIAFAAGKSVGLLVDSVADVLSPPKGSIQPAPEFGGAIDSRLVEGLVKVSDRLSVLLDLETLMSEHALSVALDPSLESAG